MASSAWAGDDLRYSRASHVITNGESLIFMERLLGHRRAPPIATPISTPP